MSFARVLAAEFRKLRRVKITWATLAFWLFMGSMAGFFLWIVANQELAASLGLIGQKANLAAGGMKKDWESIHSLIEEMAGIGGTVMLSVIIAWIFGREYAEGTAKNMLALPLPRFLFPLAKLLVAGCWLLLLMVALLAESLLVGAVFGLGPLSPDLFLAWATRILLLTLMTLSLGPAVALVALLGKGFMAPIGYTFLTVLLGSILGHTGWARWCPWSIVGMYSGAAGPRIEEIGPGSFIVLAVFFALGLAATVIVQTRSDNLQ